MQMKGSNVDLISLDNIHSIFSQCWMGGLFIVPGPTATRCGMPAFNDPVVVKVEPTTFR